MLKKWKLPSKLGEYILSNIACVTFRIDKIRIFIKEKKFTMWDSSRFPSNPVGGIRIIAAGRR